MISKLAAIPSIAYSIWLEPLPSLVSVLYLRLLPAFHQSGGWFDNSVIPRPLWLLPCDGWVLCWGFTSFVCLNSIWSVCIVNPLSELLISIVWSQLFTVWLVCPVTLFILLKFVLLFALFELSLSFALSFALFEFAGCSAVAAPGIALGRAGSDELPLAYQLSHQQMTCTFCYEPSFHLPFMVPTLTVSKWSSKDAWNFCQTFGVAGEWMRCTVLSWDGEGTCRFWPCTLVSIFLYWLFIAVPASALCRALLVFCWFC